MLKIVWILAGGAAGTLARYGVSGWIHDQSSSLFPWGTFAVNMIGSLLIGFFWGMSEKWNYGTHFKSFLFIGLFGGFTTFSSFALESLNLWKTGEVKLALVNVGLSNIAGLLLVYTGFVLAKSITLINYE